MNDFAWWELKMFPRPHTRRTLTVVTSAARRMREHGPADLSAWDAELRNAGSPL
jgi:hypothetical protein